MDVELMVFSGRPNPRWEASASEVRVFSEALETLAQPGERPSEPGLGYRGFSVRLADQVIRVFGHAVTIERNGHEQVLRDTAGVELLLVAAASRRGFSDAIPARKQQE